MRPTTRSASRVERLLGRTIDGRYHLEQRIARGAMGCVFQGRQLGLDRPVAIKVLDPKGQDEDAATFQERFRREAAILSRLQHPNTVRVFDFGHWKGHTYLVMEYVDGYSLRRLQAGGPVPASRMLPIASQICDALQEAHALGLIHRDLKPANVLLTRHAGALDVVKVVDFGLAKEFFGSTEITQAGQVLGTPMYMAPEQIRDEACDQRTDIYALGVLLFRGLTGVTPFEKGKAMAVLMAHLKQDIPSFATASPELDLPPCVEWTVRTCLAKHPDDRFATVVELKKALGVCRLALQHPSMWDVALSLDHGAVVLPDEICETSQSMVRLRVPDLEDDDAPAGSATRPSFFERVAMLPPRAMALAFLVAGATGLMLGSWMERLLVP